MTYVDVAEAARLLGVTERTVRRWLKGGRLVAFKVGGRIRIPERAVREAEAPYGSSQEASAGAAATGQDETRAERIVTWLTSPERARERRRVIVRRIDAIRARSRPPRDETETAEALVRAARDEWTAEIERRHGLDRS